MDIEDIEDHFIRDANWFGSFQCPDCNQNWGPPSHGDAPFDIVELVRCTCGAILRVMGEWAKYYEIDVEQIEHE